MSATTAADEDSISNSLLLDDLSPTKRLKELKTLPKTKDSPSGGSGGPPAAVLAAQQASIAAGLVPSATNTNSGGNSGGKQQRLFPSDSPLTPIPPPSPV